MASYSVATHKIGAYAKTLTAATVDTVTFADYLQAVEVSKEEGAAIYFTIDGSTPTVGGEGAYFLPASAAVRVIDIPNSNERPATVVKLISAGTPTYSVAKARE